MINKVKDIMGYRVPMSISAIIILISMVLSGVSWAYMTFYTKESGCRLETLMYTIKTRQDWVLINQARIMEKLGIKAMEIPK